MKFNNILATVISVLTFALFFYIIVSGTGGTDALFLIIGHISGWVAAIVIFYWRKKPSQGVEK